MDDCLWPGDSGKLMVSPWGLEDPFLRTGSHKDTIYKCYDYEGMISSN